MKPPRREPEELIGTRIAARYELERVIGAGTMGSVFEAQELVGGRRVAIKLLHEANRRQIARLEREVQAMNAVSSPHIAISIDAGFDDATQMPFHVMELLRGESLATVFKRTKVLSPPVAMAIAAQASGALDVAHAIGVIHRDIKPANLFLADQPDGPVVKVLDFGLAKLAPQAFPGGLGLKPEKLTRPRSLVGSPRYMSPEQARSSKDVDRRTDVWSLGVVLYEALAGCSPHGEAVSVVDRVLKICTTDPKPLGEAAPHLGQDIARIVMRAVSRERKHRYASAASMREELLDWLGGACDLDADFVGHRGSAVPGEDQRLGG